MKKLLIYIALISIISLTYLLLNNNASIVLEDKMLSSNQQYIKIPNEVGAKVVHLDSQTKSEITAVLEKVEPVLNIKADIHEDKKYSNDKFISFFINERVDQEWSDKYSDNIRGTMHDLLSLEGAWIDRLECKSTMCKLDVFKSQTPSQSHSTVSNVMRKLTTADWNDGAILLKSVNNSNDVQIIEILISRSPDTFQQ